VNWRKIGQVSAAFYLFIYVLAMVLPRKLPADGFDSAQVFFIKRLFHKTLYYSGPLEPIANVIFLIPVFLFLAWFLGPKRAPVALVICITLSATAELLQRAIPGRVSSLQDFALNSAGAAVAYLSYKAFFRTSSLN
jgi:glycopeptide antibiotics resistance protein